MTNSIERLTQRLDSAEKTYGSTSTNVAGVLSELAGLYDDLGDYAQAAQLLQRCLAIQQQLLGSEHLEVADTLSSLALEYEGYGDYEKALSLFKKSLAVTEKLVGPNHFKVATTLNDMADLFCMKEDYAPALPLCQRALEIRQKALGPEHPDVVDSLRALAEIYDGLGNYRDAFAAIQQCIAIGGKTLRPDHPLMSDALSVLGEIHSDLGNYPEALSAFHRAMAIDEKLSGPEHPDVLYDLDDMARLFGKQHDIDQSISTYVELFKRQRRYFVGQILALSDRDSLLLLQDSFESTEFFHSVCAEGSEDSSKARCAGAEELAMNKGFLEEVRVAQAALEANPATASTELRERRHSLQAQLVHVAQSNLESAQRDAECRALQSELSQLEATLAERVALIAQIVLDQKITLSDIAANLPRESVLVDFIQYRRADLTVRSNKWSVARYAAYLTFPLAKDSTNIVVKRVDLGDAAPINDTVEMICKRMSAKPPQYRARDLSPAFQRLSDLVYAPLARHLTNVSHLIICPDGQLSRVPFEMLPVGNKYLVENKTISYVTSGREVVRFTNPKTHASASKLIVMGNPDFDFDLANARSLNSAVQLAGGPSTLRSLSRDYDGLKFKPLPGAEAEARNVAKLLGDNAVLYLGADAREAELKAMQSPRILHLATHGFYFPDQEFNQTRRLPYAKGNNNWENPMVRCGIALAGANHAMQVTNALAEDGLLTGLDASILNLQGTELVILSACDSGTGEVKIGEGMMSLRRAFLIAGAQTVLASHWNINDNATSQLMTEFMRRWRAGEPRAQAWREAQLELLRSKDFSNPYFWSAFTLTGQWN